MDKRISHDWKDESPESKARWFQSLSYSERMDIFCALSDLIKSKIASGREIDLEDVRLLKLKKGDEQ